MNVEIRIVDGALARPAERGPGCGVGAVIAFEGVVRGEENGRAITGLDYEVYEGMAERELERLAVEVATSHGLMAVRVWHSRGFVAVGACSFRLEMESAHRQASLRAVAEFIDRLKRDVPIWKRAVEDRADSSQAPNRAGQQN
ncbi:MAG: molybdenum cofactor biosynthesis protein MoaE [Phycisphaerales bacterium]|nr:molybdenum cofactor biosynthesis protein MoaE [Phycisphaerales bacterium]